MIRKQIYLVPAQDQKLKALAPARGCSEAAVIRGALDRLAVPSENLIERLAAAGMLSEESHRPAGIDVERLQAVEEELEDVFSSRSGPIHLSEAVPAERAGR